MKEDFKFVLYQSDEDDVAVNAAIKDESIWLTQKGMAELFGCSTDNISLHLKNIFADGELNYDKDSPTTRSFYAMVQNKFHFAITGQTAAEIILTGKCSG